MGKLELKALVCLIFACLLRESTAVVGGDRVDEIVPWMASLRDNLGHFCGGTLIAKNVVLTAAHCLDDVRGQMKVHLGRFYTRGEDEFTSFFVSRMIVHPGFRLWYG